jgi:lipid-binding SYLF domain-containing protein
MGSGSVGLQIGVEVSEVILLVMTQNGVDAFLSTKVQLGADVSVAAGPVGAGAEGATADIQGFARSKGVYAGLSFDGAVISPDDSRNRAYYGEDVSPSDILVRKKVHSEHASPLLEEVSKIDRAHWSQKR